MTSAESKNAIRSIRSEFKKWTSDLDLAWLAKGVQGLATNLKEKPVANGHSARDREINLWDITNEQGRAILLERVDKDIRKHTGGDMQSSKCYRIYRWLRERYGGRHNSTLIQEFTLKTKAPLRDDITIEIFLENM